MKKIKFFLILQLLIGLPVIVFANDNKNLSQIRKDYPNISNHTFQTIAKESKLIKDAGLDPALIINKFQEGLAKNVPEDIIQRIISDQRRLYLKAEKQISQNIKKLSVRNKSSLAKAIVLSWKRGVKDSDTEKFIKNHRTSNIYKIGKGLDFLADLAQMGIHDNKAQQISDSFMQGKENDQSKDSRYLQGTKGSSNTSKMGNFQYDRSIYQKSNKSRLNNFSKGMETNKQQNTDQMNNNPGTNTGTNPPATSGTGKYQDANKKGQ